MPLYVSRIRILDHSKLFTYVDTLVIEMVLLSCKDSGVFPETTENSKLKGTIGKKNQNRGV